MSSNFIANLHIQNQLFPILHSAYTYTALQLMLKVKSVQMEGQQNL
jgi:hypothetical protein